ncbi:glutathione S-transferase N-terminal domain-containing protein [Conexibacter stalactiti]|uniref:Glutathione S-transferase N-terminal domain-containing protein n=1 Tax=Conexibacter stalactiti TaxID=1940611 RepID=A0ABU4HVG2_9ACTN|nr:glutathione S-transferase N-terminal domain-containing protein [Conexibacter stalactiti]MDW5597278.1 glutathione S-transferase N-terminal domain-containing protein [Conexibacter stalactiti]MEC5037920.1 glutathione S-transferase N-terminal domain-containing protein [Conexibacter stalactiti]
MDVTLYTMPLSHPGWSVQLALARKGVEAKVVDLPAGLHPGLLWLRGFRRGTVPSARIDGRRVEGSLEIVRELERLVPEPSLYPADPAARAAVEEAERWGEATFQNLPRQVARYAIAHDLTTRTWINREHVGLPLPKVSAVLATPVALGMAARADANATGAQSALAALPAALDRVDELLAAGTLGDDDAPNAAGTQIAPTVRLISANADMRELTDGRPCGAWAERLLPDYPLTPGSAAIAKLRRESA